MNDSGFFYQPKPEWNPHQLEIKFFWPLTEQIPLDLDYEGCAVKNPHVYSGVGINGSTGVTVAIDPGWVTTATLSIDAETVKFNNLEMPWYRKILFKLMGFKWNK